MREVAAARRFAGMLGSAQLFNAGGVRVEAAGGGLDCDMWPVATVFGL